MPKIRTLSPQTLHKMNDTKGVASWLREIADELEGKDTDDFCVPEFSIKWYTQEEIDHSIEVHRKKGIYIKRVTEVE